MGSYGQQLILDNGLISVSGYASRDEATAVVVELATKDGWRPRRWWQLWRPRCPPHVRAAFQRQQKR